MFAALLIASMLLQDQKTVAASDAPPKDRRVQIITDDQGMAVAQIVSKQSDEVLRQFKVMDDLLPDGPCASVLQIEWPRKDTITAVCHQNPSDSVYVEIDAETLKTKRAMMISGTSVVASPDHSKVAAFGPVPHFSNEDGQSQYLIVDNSDIYPLRPGKHAEALAPLAIYSKTASGDIGDYKTGAAVPTVSGMHAIGALAWSPDSTRLAIIDTTYDLTPGPDTPKEIGPAGTNTHSNEKTALVVIDMDGQAQSFPLTIREGQTPAISWKDAAHVEITITSIPKIYVVK